MDAVNAVICSEVPLIPRDPARGWSSHRGDSNERTDGARSENLRDTACQNGTWDGIAAGRERFECLSEAR